MSLKVHMNNFTKSLMKNFTKSKRERRLSSGAIEFGHTVFLSSPAEQWEIHQITLNH